MKVTDNRPLPDKQPFHRDLDVEVWMSEPDFRIGVDEELVSSLESLHEDLYFVTLDFFDALGRTTTRRRLAAPGKIFPIIHPERRGQAGHRCACSTPATRRRGRSSRCAYDEKGGAKPETVRRELDARSTPRAAGAARRGRAPTRSARSSSRVEAEGRSRSGARGRRARRARAAARPPGCTRRRCPTTTSIASALVDRAAGHARRGASIAHTGVVGAVATCAPRRRSRRRRSSTWDHVIGPDESEEIVGKLAAYPGSQRLQARAVVSRPRHFGDGDHAAVARRAACRWRSSRRSSRRSSSPAGSTPTRCRRRATSCGSASCSRPTAPIRTILQEGERHPASGREPRRRADGLRAAEADADAHAARRPLQRARHGRRRRRWGSPIRCCPNRSCAAGCGRTGCRTST